MTTDIRDARRELTALAAAMRGWDEGRTTAAMLAAEHAGWDFEQIAREVFRLLLMDDGEPRALLHLARNTSVRATDPPKSDGAAWAAEARQRLLQRGEPGSAA